MKISKLFHWLYALVMFLPILVFIPNVFYFAFNEHAQLSNSEPIVDIETDIVYKYKYETNEVNSTSDLIVGNVYNFNCDNSTLDIYFGRQLEFQAKILQVNGYDLDYYYDDFYIEDLLTLNSGNVKPYIIFNLVDDYYFSFITYLGDDYFTIYGNDFPLDEYEFSLNFDFELLYFDGTLNDSSIFTSSNFNTIESATASSTYTIDYEDTTITGAVSNGWDQVWGLPIFTWTHNTFFSAPFNYISGLFGFTSDNSISYLLSYWFSISLIWLVFDLMIYVPMLVHRWLDKASLS